MGGRAAAGSGREARDERWMRRCLELAKRAEGRTAPNPMVGCVVVDERGRAIAEGYHHRAGELHAEAEALAQLGGRATGCTMYVNLEPCRHTGGRRTAPCAPAVAEAGIARLVVGMLDPIRSHAGGASWLAERDIEVTRGVLEDACVELNRAFVVWATRGRPLFVLKAAITLDGKVATRTGESQWITGEEARRHAHGLRDRCDAVVVGIGTVLADDPRLTVRVPGGRDPVRVVVDARLETPTSARVLPANSPSPARVIVAGGEAAGADRRRALEVAGAEVWKLPAAGGGPDARIDLAALAEALGREGIGSALVEGGAELHAGFAGADLADELVLYLAPMAFGGRADASGLGWLGGAGVARLADARRFRFAGDPVVLGDDLALTLRRRS